MSSPKFFVQKENVRPEELDPCVGSGSPDSKSRFPPRVVDTSIRRLKSSSSFLLPFSLPSVVESRPGTDTKKPRSFQCPVDVRGLDIVHLVDLLSTSVVSLTTPTASILAPLASLWSLVTGGFGLYVVDLCVVLPRPPPVPRPVLRPRTPQVNLPINPSVNRPSTVKTTTKTIL